MTTSLSLEDAFSQLREFGPMTAAELRAELYDLFEQVEAHHGCHWVASVSTSPEVIYAEAEDWAEQDAGVALEAPESDLCLTIEIDAVGELGGYNERDDEEYVRFTLIFEDYDDDWMKTVESADVYGELDLSLAEAWDQLGDRPVSALFWEG